MKVEIISQKRHTAEEIVAKLQQVDVLTAQEGTVAEAVRQIGVPEVTYSIGPKSELALFGSIRCFRFLNWSIGRKTGTTFASDALVPLAEGNQVKCLKRLEAENARLRRGV